MVDIKLQIDSDFFNEEEREGYKVTKQMKEVWAIELDLLNEFKNFCSANSLKWFVDGGTALGTARHNGFVPWDNDIDVVMPREDYERFLNIANFDTNYNVIHSGNTEGYVGYHAMFMRTDTTAITRKGHMNKWKFPQGIWIDIFPIDKFSKITQVVKDYDNILEYIKAAGALRNDAYLNDKEIPNDEIRELLAVGKEIMTEHNNDETEGRFSYTAFAGTKGTRFGHNYQDGVEMDFEMLKVIAPNNLEETLAIQYGNWHKAKKGTSYHKVWLFDTENPYTEYI